ncbi:MAG: hypothetical protein ISR65_02920 [Bacteriovoracaceae bacterium]|nr:hypothetical protein [Bacteriovoracaceae bacterium]
MHNLILTNFTLIQICILKNLKKYLKTVHRKMMGTELNHERLKEIDAKTIELMTRNGLMWP